MCSEMSPYLGEYIHGTWRAPVGPSGMNESLLILAELAMLPPPPLLWMCCAAIFQEDHPSPIEADDVIVTRNRT